MQSASSEDNDFFIEAPDSFFLSSDLEGVIDLEKSAQNSSNQKDFFTKDCAYVFGNDQVLKFYILKIAKKKEKIRLFLLKDRDCSAVFILDILSVIDKIKLEYDEEFYRIYSFCKSDVEYLIDASSRDSYIVEISFKDEVTKNGI